MDKTAETQDIEGLTSHSNHDIVKVAKAYINNNRNRVEVTRKVPMDGKLLLDEELRSYDRRFAVCLRIRCQKIW